MPLYRLGQVEPKRPQGFHFVAKTAIVIGNVELGLDSGIWFGVVIRGDNEPIVVGDRSNIQENSVLHTDPGFPLTIGKDCTIGHKVMLHGCTLGDRVLIGMGAIVLNGAEIGDDCLIGAGALVTGNSKIPPRSLVIGSPAKGVRPLKDKEVGGLKKPAAHYAENANRYAAEFAPV